MIPVFCYKTNSYIFRLLASYQQALQEYKV